MSKSCKTTPDDIFNSLAQACCQGIRQFPHPDMVADPLLFANWPQYIDVDDGFVDQGQYGLIRRFEEVMPGKRFKVAFLVSSAPAVVDVSQDPENHLVWRLQVALMSNGNWSLLPFADFEPGRRDLKVRWDTEPHIVNETGADCIYDHAIERLMTVCFRLIYYPDIYPQTAAKLDDVVLDPPF